MYENLIDTSITTALLKYSYRKYQYIENIFIEIYKRSYIYKFFEAILRKIRIYYEYSLLSKIMQFEEKQDLTILAHNSRFVQFLINLYKRSTFNFNYYLKISKFANFIQSTKDRIYLSPTKTISIIVIIAIITNTALSLIFKRNIILGSWLLRSLFLFIGLSCLFSNINSQTLKENSITLKWINRKTIK